MPPRMYCPLTSFSGRKRPLCDKIRTMDDVPRNDMSRPDQDKSGDDRDFRKGLMSKLGKSQLELHGMILLHRVKKKQAHCFYQSWQNSCLQMFFPKEHYRSITCNLSCSIEVDYDLNNFNVLYLKIYYGDTCM